MEAELQRLRRENEVLRQERDIVIKGYAHRQPEPGMNYQIIETHRGEGSVETLCGALGCR